MKFEVEVPVHGTWRFKDDRAEEFIHQHKGKTLIFDIIDPSALSGKSKLFNYYNGVFLPVATKAFRDVGYNYDDAATDAHLMNEFGRSVFHKHSEQNEDGEEIYLPTTKSSWTKQKLSDYVDDCILFLIEQLGAEAPDSVEYLKDEEKKKKFQSIKILNKSKFDF